MFKDVRLESNFISDMCRNETMVIEESINLGERELGYLTSISQVYPWFGDPVFINFNSGDYTVLLSPF